MCFECLTRYSVDWLVGWSNFDCIMCQLAAKTARYRGGMKKTPLPPISRFVSEMIRDRATVRMSKLKSIIITRLTCYSVDWLVGSSLVTFVNCGQTVHPRPTVASEHYMINKK